MAKSVALVGHHTPPYAIVIIDWLFSALSVIRLDATSDSWCRRRVSSELRDNYDVTMENFQAAGKKVKTVVGRLSPTIPSFSSILHMCKTALQ